MDSSYTVLLPKINQNAYASQNNLISNTELDILNFFYFEKCFTFEATKQSRASKTLFLVPINFANLQRATFPFAICILLIYNALRLHFATATFRYGYISLRLQLASLTYHSLQSHLPTLPSVHIVSGKSFWDVAKQTNVLKYVPGQEKT